MPTLRQPPDTIDADTLPRSSGSPIAGRRAGRSPSGCWPTPPDTLRRAQAATLTRWRRFDTLPDSDRLTPSMPTRWPSDRWPRRWRRSGRARPDAGRSPDTLPRRRSGSPDAAQSMPTRWPFAVRMRWPTPCRAAFRRSCDASKLSPYRFRAANA